MTAYRRRTVSRAPVAHFQPLPLVAVVLRMFTRKSRKPVPLPQNKDWERDEPMSGLS